MSFKKTLSAAAIAACFALPAFAESMAIMVDDAYARSANPKTGAVFMTLMNHSDTDDRLIDVRSGAAAKVEIHTHKDMGEGVMKMMRLEEGIAVPAGGDHALKRGGDHIMFMGVFAPFQDGETVPLTLIFEKAGEVTLQVTVDQDRKAAMKMDHAGHSNN